MAMTLVEIEATIVRMERELGDLRASLDYQQSVAAIRSAVASIGDGRGRPIDDVVAEIRRRRADSRVAAAASR